jgi:hypothetical protein
MAVPCGAALRYAALSHAEPCPAAAEEEATIAFHRPRTSEIQAFKQAVSDLLTEYYSSGDLAEAAVSLQVGPALLPASLCCTLTLPSICTWLSCTAAGTRRRRRSACRWGCVLCALCVYSCAFLDKLGRTLQQRGLAETAAACRWAAGCALGSRPCSGYTLNASHVPENECKSGDVAEAAVSLQVGCCMLVLMSL